MVNYSNGIIYKIVCIDTEIKQMYIGSTTNFNRRRTEHKCTCNLITGKNYNLNVYQFIRSNGGWDNWSMIQLEAYSAADKRQLETRERYYIDLMKPSLNKVIPTRDMIDWRTENKVEIDKKNKIYKSEHKVEISKKGKIYRNEHKLEISKNQKIYQSENKVKLNLYNKKYRTENKDKKKIHNDLNKDKINEQRRNRRFYNKIENFILS
jgi:hypothetical protein